MPRREYDFTWNVAKKVWAKAKRVAGRDPSRWRYDILGWPVLKPLRSRSHGLLCYQLDHKVSPLTEDQKKDLFYSSVLNCQILSSWVNRAKSNKDLTRKELLKYQLSVQPTRGVMDLGEVVHFGNITNEDGEIIKRCYTREQMKTRKLLAWQIPAYSIPTEDEMNEVVELEQANDNIISKSEQRRELGLDPNLPAVLLIDSRQGTTSVNEMASALAESLFDKDLEIPVGQLIVICRQNKELFYQLKKVVWRIPIQIKWHESDIGKLMGACNAILPDVLDPVVISEAIKRGTLVVLCEAILGKDAEDEAYADLAVHPKTPQEAADVIARWCIADMDM